MSGPTGLTALCLTAAYFLGALPTGLWIVRLVRGVDVRQVGSGNIGATNVMRAAGWGWGITALAVDAAKGAAVPLWLLYGPSAHPLHWPLAAGALALAGNVFNPFLHFRGGKGVGTGIGVAAAVAPFQLVLALAAFFIGFLATRIVSVGSLSAGGVFSLSALIYYLWADVPPPFLWLGFCIGVGVLVFATHRANIRRLLAGTETRLTRQK